MNLNEIASLSEEGFTALLRRVPREKSPERVAHEVAARDAEQGPYVPHEHRAYYGEAGH